MSVEQTYIQGAKVWIPREKGWETAVIVQSFEDEKPQLVVQADESKEMKILHIESKVLLPPLCYPRDCQLDKKDNLTSLAVIHEATVSNALRVRFEQRCRYNYCGIVTIAFNPYVEQVTNSSDEILTYLEQKADQLEPHIFSVAEKAYRNLQREKRDQSIVFSGETGSGKTENSKLTILYLTTADAKATQIKEKIFASLTVMQAFGHAKTAKNENSSRFGKFFEMQYNNDHNIIGANLKTYLLNRSRVVSQPTSEQNFHIFYELMSVQDRFPFLQLNEREFAYLNSGNPLETVKTNNSQSFDETINALNILGFSSKQQDEIWRVLAAILHLGNISFKRLGGPETSDNIESCLIANLHALRNLVKLFNLDQKATQPLRKWLCHKRILCQQDEILQPMSVDLATRNRDCLARFLYKKLFSWIVTQINVSLRSPCNVQSFIGVLDVCGFENHSSNSFEQFCINYANEKIQQYCVQVIFKNEQEEYLRESIGWNFNQFQDNGLCVELIEGRGGIIEIVDEETKKYIQGTKDIHFSWVQQLHTKCEKSQHFSVWQEGSADFTIHHFITSVQYDPKNFVEKNRDTAVRELLEILKDSKNNVLHKLVLDEYSRCTSAKERRRTYVYTLNRIKQNKKSVLCEFRSALAALTEALNNTSPNFVLCIKSNEAKKAWEFDPVCVLEQLHAFNVTEIIRMSEAGFFEQQSYTNFFDRYHCLLPFDETERTTDKLSENCSRIVKMYIKDFSHIKFGKTKIFLREDDIIQLEELRQKKQRRASIVIQRAFKCYVEMKNYWQLRRATVWVQSHARKCMKRRRDRMIREKRAATRIQALVRGYLTRRWYQKFLRGYAVFKLYACLRVAAIVKRDLKMQMLNLFATLIQSVYRGYVMRRRYIKMRRSAITIQTWYRGKLGKKIAKARKEDRVKQKNFEIKLDDLHIKINCLIEEHLSPEELESMHQITDEAQSTQAKSKALNRVLFEKIESLKILRGKPQNTLQERATQISEEAEQKTPQANEDKIDVLPVIDEIKEDVSEETMSSNVTSTHEVSTPPQEVSQITLEKEKEVTCESTEITASTEEIPVQITASTEEIPVQINASTEEIPVQITASTEEIPVQITASTEEIPVQITASTEETAVQITASTEEINTEDAEEVDAIEAQGASALACQATPPMTCHKEKQKTCALPEIDLNLSETFDEIVYVSTISANETFKTVLCEEDDKYSYQDMLEAYDKFDKRSEEIRLGLKLGDYELVKQKMLNRNSEISIHKINKITPAKVKSFTDISLDLSHQKHYQLKNDLADDVFVEEKKKCLGMCQFDVKFTSPLVYHLVIDMEVSTILQSSPVMPATILFMCIRYLDSVNNNDAVILIMHVYKRAVEGLIKNFKAVDATLLWVANTHQLLNYLKQYSKIGSFGWEQHHLQNTERQAEYHLHNLDVNLLYDPLHVIGVWLFRKALKLVQIRITELVVPAILENEDAIGDVTFDQIYPDQVQRLYCINHLYRLLKELTTTYNTCVACGVSRKVTIQFFEQIFDFINLIALNSILCRKEFCNNMKGTKIRCNIRTIEQWAANRTLSKAIESLAPVIEAMRLLHMLPFTSSAVDEIVGCFRKLNYNQILKIISSYKPPCELLTFDQQTIVQKMQLKIIEDEVLDNTVTSNNSDKIALILPFEYSPIHFDEIQISNEFKAGTTIELI